MHYTHTRTLDTSTVGGRQYEPAGPRGARQRRPYLPHTAPVAPSAHMPACPQTGRNCRSPRHRRVAKTAQQQREGGGRGGKPHRRGPHWPLARVLHDLSSLGQDLVTMMISPACIPTPAPSRTPVFYRPQGYSDQGRLKIGATCESLESLLLPLPVQGRRGTDGSKTLHRQLGC